MIDARREQTRIRGSRASSAKEVVRATQHCHHFSGALCVARLRLWLHLFLDNLEQVGPALACFLGHFLEVDDVSPVCVLGSSLTSSPPMYGKIRCPFRAIFYDKPLHLGDRRCNAVVAIIIKRETMPIDILTPLKFFPWFDLRMAGIMMATGMEKVGRDLRHLAPI